MPTKDGSRERDNSSTVGNRGLWTKKEIWGEWRPASCTLLDGRQTGSYPETGFAEMNGDLPPEADFGPAGLQVALHPR